MPAGGTLEQRLGINRPHDLQGRLPWGKELAVEPMSPIVRAETLATVPASGLRVVREQGRFHLPV